MQHDRGVMRWCVLGGVECTVVVDALDIPVVERVAVRAMFDACATVAVSDQPVRLVVGIVGVWRDAVPILAQLDEVRRNIVIVTL